MVDNRYPSIFRELENFYVEIVKIVNGEGWLLWILFGVLFILLSIEASLFAAVGG